MRRVDPQQRLFTQKTEQLLAALFRLRLTRGWDFSHTKDRAIISGASPVATNAGLGFLSFSPLPSQSAPEASSSVFLTEDEVPPSN